MADTASLDRLKRMTAWTSVPALTSDDLEALLAQFAMEDPDGLASGDEDWLPTYNFRAAAREAWTIKMGRAAELTSSDFDGDRMSADQIFMHCQRMVQKYSGAASPAMGTTTSEFSPE